MISVRSLGLLIGWATLLTSIFFVFSDAILSSGDHTIGLLQLSAIVIFFSISLCAFDFSLFWLSQSSLSGKDWTKSVLLFITGVCFLIVNNIFYSIPMIGKESLFWLSKPFTQIIGILLITIGLLWRFQHTLFSSTLRTINYLERPYNSRWLYIILFLFLSFGALIAFGEIRDPEVFLTPIRFLILCLISLLTGLGLLNLLLGKYQPLDIYMLAPVSGIAVWALILGVGVSLRLPVWLVSIPLWGVTIWFVWSGLDRQILQSTIPYFVIALLMTLVLTYLFTFNGYSYYMGSPFLDGWSYVAYGQYLWELPRGSEGGLQPLYQYAAHLSHSRYVGSSLLGFLSIITGKAGDTHAAFGFVFPFIFFGYASTLIAISLNKLSGVFPRFVFITCAVFSGWCFIIMKANNLDQGFVLAFFPTLALLATRLELKHPRSIIFLVLIASACIYIYPELSPFIIISAALLFLEKAFLNKLPWRNWLPGAVAATVLIILVLSPYLSELINFMTNQLAAASRSGNRPGTGTVPELLDFNYMFIALWGLGGNLSLNSLELIWFWIRMFIAFILSLIAGLGVIRLLRDRNLGSFMVVVLFACSILFYLGLARYDYAAYKLLSISGWFILLIVVGELQYFISSKKNFINRFLYFTSTLILIGYVIVFFIQVKRFTASISFTSATPFRQLENIPGSADTPLIISINNMILNQWSVYYLREHRTFLYPYRGSANQPHVIPLMERSEQVDVGQVRTILTEHNPPLLRPAWNILWENEFYTLWEVPPRWSYIVVSNPNGIESNDAPVRFWLSNEITFLDILTANKGAYALSLNTIQGPSLPETMERHVRIVDPAGKETVYTWADGQYKLTISLLAGKNRISLQVLDQPSISVLPNGDTRKLLLGISHLQVNALMK